MEKVGARGSWGQEARQWRRRRRRRRRRGHEARAAHLRVLAEGGATVGARGRDLLQVNSRRLSVVRPDEGPGGAWSRQAWPPRRLGPLGRIEGGLLAGSPPEAFLQVPPQARHARRLVAAKVAKRTLHGVSELVEFLLHLYEQRVLELRRGVFVPPGALLLASHQRQSAELNLDRLERHASRLAELPPQRRHRLGRAQRHAYHAVSRRRRRRLVW